MAKSILTPRQLDFLELTGGKKQLGGKLFFEIGEKSGKRYFCVKYFYQEFL